MTESGIQRVQVFPTAHVVNILLVKMADTPASDSVSEEQVVTPWVAKAGKGDVAIDYDKLISKYLASTAQLYPSVGHAHVMLFPPSTIYTGTQRTESYKYLTTCWTWLC